MAVDTGASSAQVAGHALIIHGYDGGRIGCAILGVAAMWDVEDSGDLSRGVIVGAVIGALVGAAVVCLVAYVLYTKTKPLPPLRTPSMTGDVEQVDVRVATKTPRPLGQASEHV